MSLFILLCLSSFFTLPWIYINRAVLKNDDYIAKETVV